MASKKRKKKKHEAPVTKASPQGVGTSLKGLLADFAKAQKNASVTKKPAVNVTSSSPKPRKQAATSKALKPGAESGLPSDALQGNDLNAYLQAYKGVKPIARKEATPHTESAEAPKRRTALMHRADDEDAQARARLASLVAGGVRFDVRYDEGEVQALRIGTPETVLDRLNASDAFFESQIDLHGLLADEAGKRLVRFMRNEHRRGVRRILIIHGKGIHSEGGLGVLQGVVIRQLSEGGAAPVVRAFVTAPLRHGGSGATLVELIS